MKLFGSICATLVLNASVAFADNMKVIDQFRSATEVAVVDRHNSTDGFLLNLFESFDSIIIRFGKGGNLDGMIKVLMFLQENPEKTVVIDGPCYSACTLLLAAPENVVFTENASFYFHSSFLYDAKRPDKEPKMYPFGNEIMLKVLPTNVNLWTQLTGAFNKIEFTRMENHEAVDLVPEMFVSSNFLPEFGPSDTFSVTSEVVGSIIE